MCVQDQGLGEANVVEHLNLLGPPFHGPSSPGYSPSASKLTLDSPVQPAFSSLKCQPSGPWDEARPQRKSHMTHTLPFAEGPCTLQPVHALGHALEPSNSCVHFLSISSSIHKLLAGQAV